MPTEFAPGLPSKYKKESPRISEPQVWNLAIQKHKAERAGTHYDLRIVDDKSGKAYSWATRYLPTNPGDKVLAKLQPLHTAEYSTWAGTIAKGYGAGNVQLFSNDKIEVLKADPEHVVFNVYKSTGDTERYALIHTGGDDWLFHNVTATRDTRPYIPTEKPSYKSIDINKIDITNPNQILAPKVDGSLNVFLLKKDSPIETYSYRPSKKGASKLINHTYRTPLYKITTPKAFKGNTVLLGEVFAKNREGRALPSTDTSARLLSNVWRSRELQKDAPLDNMVFNILRYQGRDVSQKPYREKLEMLKHITSAIPQLKMPELASHPETKKKLIDDIMAKRHPLSEEGVVVYNLDQPTPMKAKLQEDYDVYIRGVYPGENKYEGVAAGGFEYSFKPKGPIVGRVGTGLSDEMRKKLWEKPEEYVGLPARIFAQQQLPSGALRMPVFKDLRPDVWKKKTAALKEMYIRRMSRDDNGKRKWAWAAGSSLEEFEKNQQHLLESKYRHESPVYKLGNPELFKTALKINPAHRKVWNEIKALKTMHSIDDAAQALGTTSAESMNSLKTIIKKRIPGIYFSESGSRYIDPNLSKLHKQLISRHELQHHIDQVRNRWFMKERPDSQNIKNALDVLVGEFSATRKELRHHSPGTLLKALLYPTERSINILSNRSDIKIPLWRERINIRKAMLAKKAEIYMSTTPKTQNIYEEVPATAIEETDLKPQAGANPHAYLEYMLRKRGLTLKKNNPKIQ